MYIPASSRNVNRILGVLAGVTCLIVLQLYWQRRSIDITHIPHASPHHVACHDLSGADDILVALKTGSTEVRDKLGVHIRTTLQCYPNHLIFSDYAEEIDGERIIDALEYVNASIKAAHDDFALWRRLHEHGRGALTALELSGTDSKEKDESIRMQNPGWKLDKWKFLPMMERTLQEFPTKQWYVFVEADTYLVWSSLLPYLGAFAWTEDYYIGSELDIDDTYFAYGGSGFALSRPALEKVVELYQASQQEWEEFTDRYWAGDHVLGVALMKAGVPLLSSWPSWQGSDFGHVWFQNPFRSERIWCRPAVSSHHESVASIDDFWNFEQEWISENGEDPRILRYVDIFEKYLLPRVQKPRSDWDNNAGYLSAAESVEACAAICEENIACLQYAFRGGDNCTFSTEPYLGDAVEGVESGWMPFRLQKYFDEMEPC